ncbi:hypothetical protein MNV49_006497 [Pseudohyphozyma bogoriensis]|nr:hypothetical protein MNV49_006497 [Pseudohyphozyma bogoriensis]
MGISSRAAHARAMFDMLVASFLYPSLKVKPVNLTGKTAIVTGGAGFPLFFLYPLYVVLMYKTSLLLPPTANIGIGLESARKLASFGAHVVLACRNVQKAEVAREDIVKTTGNENVEVRQVDFGEFASVRRFVEEWGEKPIDILLNNAGATFHSFTLTKDGYESMFATNFLTHVRFTMLVLPRLSPNARIVNVSSVGNYAALRRDLDVNDLDGSKWLRSQGIKEGDLLEAQMVLAMYSKSKLCQAVFTRVLQEKLDQSAEYGNKKILVSSCHPGAVKSAIHDRFAGTGTEGYNKFMERWISAMNLLGVSTEQGACTPVYLAVDPRAA